MKSNDYPPKRSLSPQPFLKLPKLEPIKIILDQAGYRPEVVDNYQKVLDRDFHLAELYRKANVPAGSPEAGKKPRVNPIQARVDKKGRIWVDVLLEMTKTANLRGLRKIMKIHARSGRFVAGRVLADRAHELVEMGLRIETSRPVGSTLYQSVPSIKADGGSLGINSFPGILGEKKIDGHDVIIGIIDHGCDIRHQAFIKSNGDTRFLCIWDQTGGGNPHPAPFGYGVEYDANRINQALKNNIELKLPLAEGAHGTHVMGIAAGNTQNMVGVAPAADLIFVELGKATNDKGAALTPEEAEFKTLGSSWNLFNAVQYILHKADELQKPVVINISQAANGGPHDGNTIFERMLDQELAKPGRAVVIAAGNSRRDEIHTAGKVVAGETTTIEWRIDKESPPTSELRNELEIWYETTRPFQVKMFDPFDNDLGDFNLGEQKSVSVHGRADWPVVVRHVPPGQNSPGDENLVNVFVDNRGLQPSDQPAAGRFWRVELSHPKANPEDEAEIHYHAWIERNDISPSAFGVNSKMGHTLNTIGNAALPIVVGAYDSRDTALPILAESGEGPSLNKNESLKPDISAPGWRIYSASARTTNRGHTDSGTSMAAPHVSGLIALMFQAARDLINPSRTLNITEIRDILKDAADRNPPDGEGHHAQYGFGRVNALKALHKLLE